jgi:hypothetical protein
MTDEDIWYMVESSIEARWVPTEHIEYDHYFDTCKECQLHVIKTIRHAMEGQFAPVSR